MSKSTDVSTPHRLQAEWFWLDNRITVQRDGIVLASLIRLHVLCNPWEPATLSAIACDARWPANDVRESLFRLLGLGYVKPSDFKGPIRTELREREALGLTPELDDDFVAALEAAARLHSCISWPEIPVGFKDELVLALRERPDVAFNKDLDVAQGIANMVSYLCKIFHFDPADAVAVFMALLADGVDVREAMCW